MAGATSRVVVAIGGGKQGPPDLEEVWRDVNRRLTGIFGKKNPRTGGGSGSDGGDGGMPNISPRQFGGGIGVIAALVAVVWLSSGFYIVDASQRGVVLQVRRVQGNDRARPALALAVADGNQ